MNVLICGAGIAGLTAALCLRSQGHRLTVLEKARKLRGGGYMIDFSGPGYDAAESLGLLPELEAIHYPIDRLTFLDARGREKFSLQYVKLRRLFDNRHFNFLRGDLEAVLYRHVEGAAEFLFGTSVSSLEMRGEEVLAVLTDGTSRTFDLVIGADGLHSRIRSLAFGDERKFLRFLGHNTAAFMIDDVDYPEVPSGAFATMTVPGRQVAVYPVSGHRLATFFMYRAGELGDYSPESARTELRSVFQTMDWVVPHLLLAANKADELYFDSVSQVEMPTWIAGRVVLVGDAAWCLSLLAGQGSSMAMFGAQALAQEVGVPGVSVETALARYEERLRPVVLDGQRAGRNMSDWFVPNSTVKLFIRDLLTRTATWPLVSSLFKRSLLPAKA